MNNSAGFTYNFISVSVVDASGIKSKWQANFMQIFPVDYSKLPATHISDKECFNKYWRGDNSTTYEQFLKAEMTDKGNHNGIITEE